MLWQSKHRVLCDLLKAASPTYTVQLKTKAVLYNVTKTTRFGDKSRRFICYATLHSVINMIPSVVTSLCAFSEFMTGIANRIVTHFFSFFPGKILNDDTALKEYKISEKNFVVVMVTKVWELQIFSVTGKFSLLNTFFFFGGRSYP